LVCRIGARRCAFPLEIVIETMRPLPVDPVAGSPEAVMGVAIIRGLATPVLDLSAMFEARTEAPQRFVTVRTAGRVVALAVDSVVGVSRLDRASLQTLPPLLGDAQTSAIESIGSADNELLVVLRSARIAPTDLFGGQSS
jgi:purine-binding chemotaxis protein CheW